MDSLSRSSRIPMGVVALWRRLVSIMIPAVAVSVALFIDLDSASAVDATTTKFKATSPLASIAYINSSSYIHDITTSDVSFRDSLNTLSTRQSLHRGGMTKYTWVPRSRATRDAKKSGSEEVRREKITSTSNYVPDSCNTIFSDVSELGKCVCPNTLLGREVNCDEVGDVPWTFVLPQEVRVLSATHCNLPFLPAVSESAKNIVSLNVSYNIISEVEDKLLKFPYLEILDLSLNNLRALDLYVLELPYLSSLNVSFNKLQYFSSKPFRISSLNLSSNYLTDTSFISNLIHMKNLDLSRNRISFVEKDTFKSLTQLKFLDLSHNRIEGTSFIPQLSETISIINLSNNSIKRINQARDLYSLEELNIGSNAISEINLSDLPKTLDTLNVSDNYISHIREISAGDSQIVNLFIAKNSLSDVKFVKYMSNLKTIDLSFNDLRNIDGIYFRNNKINVQLNGTNLDSISFTLNCDVRILNIENNNITCLPTEFFNINRNLREMYVLNNPLQKLYCPLSTENIKLLKSCDQVSNFHQEQDYIVIDMRHKTINDFLNCMFKIKKSRGINFFKMCHQEYCSGLTRQYISFHLLMATYILLTFI